jgi:hypothetical protein
VYVLSQLKKIDQGLVGPQEKKRKKAEIEKKGASF